MVSWYRSPIETREVWRLAESSYSVMGLSLPVIGVAWVVTADNWFGAVVGVVAIVAGLRDLAMWRRIARDRRRVKTQQQATDTAKPKTQQQALAVADMVDSLSLAREGLIARGYTDRVAEMLVFEAMRQASNKAVR